MGLYELISLILNFLFGGGLIVTLVTLRAARKKADAESKKAEAESKSAELDNAEKAANIVMEQIANPLRIELKRVNRELSRLRVAIEKGYDCTSRSTCPILNQMQLTEGGNDGDYDEGRGIRNNPRHGSDNPS